MISTLLEELTAISGISEPETLLLSLDSAAREIWNSVDLPGSLLEESFRIEVAGQISLPYYIQHIRAVKMCCQPIELNDIRPAYMDDYGQSPWTWRLIGRKPLLKHIENGSTITFERDQDDDVEVTISLVGETPLAQRIKEDVTLNGKAITENNYLALISLTKSHFTKSDIIATDSDNNVLALIPNYLTAVFHNIIEPFNKCTCGPTCGQCFDILFKSVLPPVNAEATFIFPEPFDDVLKWKALEHLFITRKDEETRAQLFGQKAAAVLQSYSNDYATGKRLKLNLPRTGYNTSHWGYL